MSTIGSNISIVEAKYKEPADIDYIKINANGSVIKLIDESKASGDVVLEDNKEVSITSNGTTEITPTSGKDAMKKVTATVAVPVPTLETNKTATINVSTYTAAVEITPTEGKDAMEKATITLSNIPEAGIDDLVFWRTGSGAHTYVMLPFSDATTIASADAFNALKCAYGDGAAHYTVADVPDYSQFDDITAYTASNASSFTITQDGADVTYEKCGGTVFIADVDTSTARSIDVSTYTAPVSLTPASGKDAMIGATVTLNNAHKLLAWNDSNDPVECRCFTTRANPSVNDHCMYIDADGVYSYGTITAVGEGTITCNATVFTRTAADDIEV